MSRLKDVALEKALLLFLRPKLKRYGELRLFRINTEDKTFTAEIKLLGEPLPVIISNAQYRLERQAGETVLVIYGVKISREWAQNILEDHFAEMPLKIPDFIRPLIE